MESTATPFKIYTISWNFLVVQIFNLTVARKLENETLYCVNTS